jgi:hypothetical protein
VKVKVWLSVRVQSPGTLGDSAGWGLCPSTEARGLETVTRMGVTGVIVAPAAGLVVACASADGGN